MTARALLAFGLLAAATVEAAEVELYQTVDRNQVGTEDTFRLTVVVANAPDTAQLQLPAPQDFEVLSRSQSTQMSYQLGGGGAGSIQRVQKYVLVMRANRAGTLTIPPAVLTTAQRTFRTESVQVEVKKGRVTDPNAAPPRQGSMFGQLPDPFRNLPLPGFPEDFGDDPFGFPEPDIPRSDSDLFLSAAVDRSEVYVGEQTTLSVYVFSRMDLSSVDKFIAPKLDGFWSEDLDDSPRQLTAESRVVGGVPYRAYLLKRWALFPTKSGTFTLAPSEADITTGYLFAGRRISRTSNPVEVKVKPLPSGAPKGFSGGNVGKWRLTVEATPTQVKLGEPVTVRVALEGQGNLRNVMLPSLTAPPPVKVYDPTTTDKVAVKRGLFGGKRVQEYLVMPQQTGTFTLPGLTLPFYDPELRRYDESRTDDIRLTVLPGAGGAHAIAGGSNNAAPDPSEKNQLAATSLKALRYQADFAAPRVPAWRRPFFIPVALAPPVLWLSFALLGWARSTLGREDAVSLTKKKAKAARARLAAAEKLAARGSADAFYAEVEKALLHFLEAKLGVPVGGLTREGLSERLSAAGISAERSRAVLAVLEACDIGRFAPGAGGGSRAQLLDDAAAAMGGWNE
ncbi:MAG: BatD family protein [Myxococcota bacterium]